MKTHIIHDDFLSFKITKVLVEFFSDHCEGGSTVEQACFVQSGDTSEIRRPDPERKGIGMTWTEFLICFKNKFSRFGFLGFGIKFMIIHELFVVPL